MLCFADVSADVSACVCACMDDCSLCSALLFQLIRHIFMNYCYCKFYFDEWYKITKNKYSCRSTLLCLVIGLLESANHGSLFCERRTL